jgi:hypothetical protein
MITINNLKHHTKESKKNISDSIKEGFRKGRIHPNLGKHLKDDLKKIREISKENKRISKEDVLFMIWELEQKIFKKHEEDEKEK